MEGQSQHGETSLVHSYCTSLIATVIQVPLLATYKFMYVVVENEHYS